MKIAITGRLIAGLAVARAQAQGRPMSKAFTSGDDAPQAPLGAMPTGRRPITASGWATVQQTLRQLTDVARPPLLAAAADGDVEARSRLRSLDWRIEFLTRQINLSDRVLPASAKPTSVTLGTMVRVRDEEGRETTYGIVGPDEVDAGQGLVSHVSPIGLALLGLVVGDWATIRRPMGDREVEVCAIEPS